MNLEDALRLRWQDEDPHVEIVLVCEEHGQRWPLMLPGSLTLARAHFDTHAWRA